MAINRIKYVNVNSETEDQDFVNFTSPEYVFETLSVTENGIYVPTGGVTAYNKVIVSVSTTINNQDITVTENGVYTAGSGYSGLGQVTVDIPNPTLETITIRQNGTYTPTEYGFSEVVVEVSDIPAVIESLSITPTTSAQTFTPATGIDGYAPISVSAVTSSIDSNITAGNIKSGVSILGVNGNLIESNETTLNITPTTSSQQITPTGSYTGFDEVNVSAVDNTIDSNITPENIVSGKTILGVAGSAVELKGSTTTVNPSTSQQTIEPTSPSNGLTRVTVNAVTSAIDSNIAPENIKSGVSILGVNGSVEELRGLSIIVNPTTNDQWLQPQGDYNAFDDVFVNAVTSSIDSNIVAGNIKSGVSILGVAGSLAPVNNQNKTISSNGTYTADSGYTGLGEVTVSVPFGPADGYYKEYTLSGNTLTLTNRIPNTTSSSVNLMGATDLGGSVWQDAYVGNTLLTGTLDLSSLTTITGFSAAYNAFKNCTNITAVDLSNLVSVPINQGLYYAFYGCTGLVSADLGSLTTINESTPYVTSNGCYGMFIGCSNLTTVDLGSLTTIDGSQGCRSMFQNCSSLATIDLSALTTVKDNGCYSMFQGCTSLTSIDLSNLTTIGEWAFYATFIHCDSLRTLSFPALTDVSATRCLNQMCNFCSNLEISFPALTSTSFGTNTNQFNGMLYRATDCTVHFPSNLQSVIGSWADVQSGFDGTNTTVLFDLPATQ